MLSFVIFIQATKSLAYSQISWVTSSQHLITVCTVIWKELAGQPRFIVCLYDYFVTRV